MAKQTKVESLTKSHNDYVSEKKISVGGKDMWVIKKNATIKVMDGKEVVYDGSSRAFHRWLKEQNEIKKVSKAG